MRELLRWLPPGAICIDSSWVEIYVSIQMLQRGDTRLTPWLQRFSGAANAAEASEAGVLLLETDKPDNASLSRNLRETVRSGIETRRPRVRYW